jgi:tetratricopeptide (TPR) repeat protein
MYRLDGNMALAARFFRYSIEHAKKSQKSGVLAHATNNMAIVYFEQGDTMKAHQLFHDAMLLRLKINDPKAISESYYNLGDYYFYVNNYSEATAWYQKSLDYCRKNNLKPEHADALMALSRVAKSTGDFKGATACLEQYVNLQHQIDVANSSDDEEISDLQRTIMRLETENDVKNGHFGNERSGAPFKWEWLVIAFLGTMVILSLVMKRKSAG